MIQLARVFSDYMVLQRRVPICIWGQSDAAEPILVSLNGEELYRGTVPAGNFTIILPAQEAVEDARLVIGNVVLSHVDIGEVWIAGGQSNMEFMLQYVVGGEQEIAQAEDPHLRCYTVGQYAFPEERAMGYKD